MRLSCNHSGAVQIECVYSISIIFLSPQSQPKQSTSTPSVPVSTVKPAQHEVQFIVLFLFPCFWFLQFLYIVWDVHEPTSCSVWQTPPPVQQPSSMISIVLFPVAVKELFGLFESGLITEPWAWIENTDRLLYKKPNLCRFKLLEFFVQLVIKCQNENSNLRRFARWSVRKASCSRNTRFMTICNCLPLWKPQILSVRC